MRSYVIDLAVVFGAVAFFALLIPQSKRFYRSLFWAMGIWAVVTFAALTAEHAL